MTKLPENRSVALALGGGAVLGAAHIGVLRALHELNITVTHIAGTSIGALVAALFAFDRNYEKVEDLAIDLSWNDIAGFSLSKFGLFSNSKIAGLITDSLGNVRIEEARIPLAIVATDIESGNRVVLQKGAVSEAVQASTCIPGIFQPVKIGNTLLVDGGIAENVPITPLREMGATFILAVDLNASHTYGAPANLVDVLMNSFHFTLAHAAKQHTSQADILLQPDLSEFNRVSTGQTEALIQKGYQEAKNRLSQV